MEASEGRGVPERWGYSAVVTDRKPQGDVISPASLLLTSLRNTTQICELLSRTAGKELAKKKKKEVKMRRFAE